MQWIDANAEEHEQRARQGLKGPKPILGVCYRSECGRFRVAANRHDVPEVDRTWSLWDMTGPTPMRLGEGKSLTVAMRAGEAVAVSRALRVGLRLAAIGRAVWAGVRRLTA